MDDAGGAFFVGAWLVILGGLFGIVALIGFYDVLRSAGPVLILAPILGAVGLTLVTLSHLIPIAMAYELVPGYTDADAATRSSLAVTTDTLAILSLVVNYSGNLLGWGIAVPLFALAILEDVGRAEVARLAGPRRRCLRGLAEPDRPSVERHRRVDRNRVPRLLHLDGEHGYRAAPPAAVLEGLSPASAL